MILDRVKGEIHKAIVGQDNVIDLVLTCLLANGHTLVTGVPGLAKTLLVRTIAQSLGLKFQRIQFTADLMPMDILGTEVLKTQGRDYELEWIAGPIFANLVLADEINRATPRTQSALLQAMQEREIHVLNRHFILEPPFMVMATRNPIDQEGTFPLPEAQLDRFLMNVNIDYPVESEEIQMLELKGKGTTSEPVVVMSREEIMSHQKKVYDIGVSKELLKKIVQLVSKTRPETNPSIAERVYWGAGPRASEALLHVSRAYAYLIGDSILDWSHVQKVAFSVLNHRVEMQMRLGHRITEKENFLRELIVA